MPDFGTPGTLSVEFSRQEYWSGLPFPSSGDLPDLGIKLGSPALQADSLPLNHQGLFVSLNVLSSHCNTELVNPEPLLLEKYRVGFLPASGYNILFTHSCVTLFYMCFCLETPYLIYVADWSSQPSAL